MIERLAVFFQKNSTNKVIKYCEALYKKIFLRSIANRVKWLKGLGANIGDNVYFDNVEMFGTEPYLITVGSNVYFSGGGVHLYTHDGSIMQLSYMGLTDKKYDMFGEIIIGDNCFIGAGVTILYNVHIHDNCIIGAGAVVANDIPEGSIAVGCPAKVIGSVDNFYKRHYQRFENTYGWNKYKKRTYLEEKVHSKNINKKNVL